MPTPNGAAPSQLEAEGSLVAPDIACVHLLLGEVVVAPGGLLILSIVASTVLHTQVGWPMWTWAPFAAGAGLLVWFLVWRGIKMSTAASIMLGATSWSSGQSAWYQPTASSSS